jgi:hypothetical protein
VECSCEHCNEHSSSIEYWEILGWLRILRILKKATAPWSLLISFSLVLQDYKTSHAIILHLLVTAVRTSKFTQVGHIARMRK